MNKPKRMNINRWARVRYASLLVAESDKALGNTDIARAMNLSRQAVNNIMKDAVSYGYVAIVEIDWRPNVKAQRYVKGLYHQLILSDADNIRWQRKLFN